MSDLYVTTPPQPTPDPLVGLGTTGSSDGSGGKSDAAKEQASHLKDTAADAGKQVAGTAKEKVSDVASEAKTQAKDLYGQAKNELHAQAGTQQERVAAGLHSISDELGSMADSSENGGAATDLVRNVAGRANSVASWLDDRDPGSLLDEVSAFARQRPGTFIALAAVAGVLAGRLTRSVVSVAKDEKEESAASGSSDLTGYPNTVGVSAAATDYSTDSFSPPTPSQFTEPPVVVTDDYFPQASGR